MHLKCNRIHFLITFSILSLSLAFAIHLGFQPYNDNSNNVLMGAGKMQLFLTLMLALLLKMEAAFFTGNAQMDEADLSSLTSLIIGSSAALVLLWIGSVLNDCYSAKKRRKREKKRLEEARARRKRFKRTTNLLKAATLKNKMLGSMGGHGKQLGIMNRKRLMKQKENDLLKKLDKTNLDRKRNAAGMFAGLASSGHSTLPSKKQSKKIVATNFVAKSLGQKPDTLLMREARTDFGAGSEIYMKVIDIITKIKNGEINSENGKKSLDSVLSITVPTVSEEKRATYGNLIMKIKNEKEQRK